MSPTSLAAELRGITQQYHTGELSHEAYTAANQAVWDKVADEMTRAAVLEALRDSEKTPTVSERKVQAEIAWKTALRVARDYEFDLEVAEIGGRARTPEQAERLAELQAQAGRLEQAFVQIRAEWRRGAPWPSVI